MAEKGDSKKLDWSRIGLKVGLEIHQQLKTPTKLFCHCPVEHREEDGVDTFPRRLRPTRSELGEVDTAAYFEWRKGRTYVYHAPRAASCLVEADEEPPHPISREAVLITLGMARAFGSAPVDEIHVMRKIVIDGSNTTGFQRTALVALGGSVVVDGKNIGIQTICVEEDASRKLEEKGLETHYGLERLGIPLIEISTAPDIRSPEEALRVAKKIGQMLRLTGRVKRGIGTIRQDLNVSIEGGVKTEIKGVQELQLLPKVIENEARRQLGLLEIRDEMRRRGLLREDFTSQPIVDVTDVMSQSKSRVVKRNLSKKGAKALAVRVPGMRGLLGREIQEGRRFGSEVADYARFWGDVKGLFHGDELPGYGIGEEEVRALESKLGVGEGDSFLLIVDVEENARRALRAAVERIAQALEGIPRETRMAQPDGTTRFLRPQPGAARMYPETDIPLRRVDESLLKEAEEYAPPDPSVKLEFYTSKLGLNRQLAQQVLDDENMLVIEELMEKYRESVEPSYIASVLTGTLRALRREGVPVESLEPHHFDSVFRLLASGDISKEAVETLLKLMAENPREEAEVLVEKHGLRVMPREQVEAIVEEIISQSRDQVLQRGERAVGLIMGKAMARLRGKAPGKIVLEIVREKVQELLKREGSG